MQGPVDVGRALPAGDAEDGGEVVEVLACGEVGVDGRRLGDVADPGAQVAVARRTAEDGEGAGDVRLRADDRPHQGGLAAAAGAEQAGDAAARDGEAEPVEDGAATAYDTQADGLDGGGRAGSRRFIHHTMNMLG